MLDRRRIVSGLVVSGLVVSGLGATGLAVLTSSRTRPRAVNFTALSVRFSSAARSRTGSPIALAGRSPAINTSAESPPVPARADSDAATASASLRGENASRRIARPVALKPATSCRRFNIVLSRWLARPQAKSVLRMNERPILRRGCKFPGQPRGRIPSRTARKRVNALLQSSRGELPMMRSEVCGPNRSHCTIVTGVLSLPLTASMRVS